MKEKDRNSIERIIKFPQFTTMNVIDGQAGLVIYSSLIFYSLTIDNILNILLTKVEEAKNTNIDAEVEEQIRLACNKIYADDYISKYTPEEKAEALKTELDRTGYTATLDGLKVIYRGKEIEIKATGEIKIKQPLPTVAAGETAPNDSNAVYTSGDYTAVIPAGFTVSDVKVVNETTIENGLVVTDGSGNQWVWIPVSSSDLALMYVEDEAGWTMLGTAEPNEVVTKYKTLGATLGSRTLNRTTPGTTTDPYYREPDVLSTYDTEANYRKAAGFVEADGTTASSLETMATKLKDDYKEMIESVKTNGGFYVGRYELGKDSSNNPQVKPGTVMNDANWYSLYKACKSFLNGNVESRMVWGCQWDQICRFIKGNGANSIIDDSRAYGNYDNSSGDAATNSGRNKFNNTTGQLNDNWKIKNLYDIAGNCWEWTQEVCFNDVRAFRGR